MAATKVIMPQLGGTGLSAKITAWLHKEGDQITEFEPLLEVNTEKLGSEIPSPASGILLNILIPEGEIAEAGTILAWIGQPENGNAHKEAGAALQVDFVEEDDADLGEDEFEDGGIQEEMEESPEAFISPVVSRLVEEFEVDLKQVKGTGLNGRITRHDILSYISKRDRLGLESHDGQDTQQPDVLDFLDDLDHPKIESMVADKNTINMVETPSAKKSPAAQRSYTASDTAEPDVLDFLDTDESEPALWKPENHVGVPGLDEKKQTATDDRVSPLSSERKALAEQFVISKRAAPHAFTVMEADMRQVSTHYKSKQAAFSKDGTHLSYTAYFLMAAVAALKAHPQLNTSWTGQGIQMHSDINIELVVGLPPEGGLSPVIQNADSYSLLGLARTINNLSEQARQQNLSASESQGGTFTIVEHGTDGPLLATSIIRQPQCAVLNIGQVKKRPVVIENAIAIRPMVYLTLTYDSRILDPHNADTFLANIVSNLEEWPL